MELATPDDSPLHFRRARPRPLPSLADPSERQKLRELAGLGWSITVALPGGAAAMDGAIRLCPIPVSGSLDDPQQLRWSRRALRKLLTDVRPDLVHVEEAPGTPGAWAAVREATRSAGARRHLQLGEPAA